MSRPRADKRGGGVGLYITDKTSFKVRDDLVMNPFTCQYESLFIETVMHDHKAIIGVSTNPQNQTLIYLLHTSVTLSIL